MNNEYNYTIKAWNGETILSGVTKEYADMFVKRHNDIKLYIEKMEDCNNADE